MGRKALKPRRLLLLRGGIHDRAVGWKCSRSCCFWEEKLPPGEMADAVRLLFDKDAEESFARHLANCPIQREKVTA